MSVLDAFSRTRHFDERHQRSLPVYVGDPTAVQVRVSEGLAPIATDIAERLGSSFGVTVGPPAGGNIAVVAALGREATAFLRAQHPDAVLLVVKRGATGHENDALDYLEAGADQFLESGSLDEISLHIRALARRTHQSRNQR